MVRWVVGSTLHGVDPLSYFLFQPVLNDWFNKVRGMCYPVCGMVHLKEPLLLIGKSSPCVCMYVCSYVCMYVLFPEGPDTVTLSPPSPGPVTEGHSLTVTCAADCNPSCDFSWTLRDQQISSTSELALTNINRSQTGNVYKCTATHTVTHKSKTKQFTLAVHCEYYYITNVKSLFHICIGVVSCPRKVFIL